MIKDKMLKITSNLLLAIIIFCVFTFCTVFVYFCSLRIFVYPLPFSEIVFEYADGYGLDRALVYSVIKRESRFNPKAESSVGAKGLMQITEETGNYIAEKLKVENYDLKDVETNINFGCYYIKYLIEKFGDYKLAVTAYNAGEGSVCAWLNSSDYSIDGSSLYYIPFNETRRYVEEVEKSFLKYKKLYGKLLDKT